MAPMLRSMLTIVTDYYGSSINGNVPRSDPC
jgi:hypothetical protein